MRNRILAIAAIMLLFCSEQSIAAAADTPSIAARSQQPTVVFVYARTCRFCKAFGPVVDQLEAQFKDKANFVRLDVTDAAARNKSRSMAEALSIDCFLSFYEDTYPAVGIFSPSKKCLKEFYGINEKDRIASIISRAIQSN